MTSAVTRPEAGAAPQETAADVNASPETFLTRLDACLSEHTHTEPPTTEPPHTEPPTTGHAAREDGGHPGLHECGEGATPSPATVPEVLTVLADGRELRTRDLAAAVLAGRGCRCDARPPFTQALLDLLKGDARVGGTLRRPTYWWRSLAAAQDGGAEPALTGPPSGA
ncbi:hypothetical protein MF672_033170 [Actinomadura sp. ATCC 31491]|uniref:Uncharacterized protein n=1 Tax=Actinomadura luzonensis TaxID=2805427 RepID=A0ABT0G1X8_9ACTN|nr:hypothetical protein [Actinomadura luzonensis]MCK2218612.1 hypothetical protein [Actinomadura luzonensis]